MPLHRTTAQQPALGQWMQDAALEMRMTGRDDPNAPATDVIAFLDDLARGNAAASAAQANSPGFAAAAMPTMTPPMPAFAGTSAIGDEPAAKRQRVEGGFDPLSQDMYLPAWMPIPQPIEQPVQLASTIAPQLPQLPQPALAVGFSPSLPVAAAPVGVPAKPAADPVATTPVAQPAAHLQPRTS